MKDNKLLGALKVAGDPPNLKVSKEIKALSYVHYRSAIRKLAESTI